MSEQYWWACEESYRGSGRPSRIWAVSTDSPDVRPDDPDENGYRPYPFNDMGGSVAGGPFSSREEAMRYLEEQIIEDADGYLQWK